VVAAHAFHQLLVNFPDEPERQGQGVQPRDTVFQGNDIVAHFS